MNVAILRGRLSSPPREQQLASGDVLVSLEVTTRGADGQAQSVPVAWFSKATRVARWASGEEVVVVGIIRRRFFRTGNGATASRTEVVADHVLLANRTTIVARVVDHAIAVLDQLARPPEPAKPVKARARMAAASNGSSAPSRRRKVNDRRVNDKGKGRTSAATEATTARSARKAPRTYA